MKKGFSIICSNCGERVNLNNHYKKEEDESDITISVFGSGDFKSVYLTCTNCKNDLEIEA
ncbi:hypothetical protein ABE25_15545 [Cytobacillus firmus]|nr:hypothetical protein [Cytobacillus firmus]MBG9655041.1 hypothetical protein [Cytobacillus firmus]